MRALRHLAIQELAAFPLRFELNRGQAPATVRFIGRGAGYTVTLSPRGAALASSGGSSAVSAPTHPHLVDANPHAAFVGLSRLPGTVNYLRGEHPSGWQFNLPTYGQVIEREVYPGIDLLYHSSAAHLEYEWLIHPGADPHPITLSLGAGRAVLSSSGDLLPRTTAGVLLQHRPHAYQTVQGRRVTVSAAYVLQADGMVRLRLSSYRHALGLVINPTLAYSTYIVSGGESKAVTIAVDATGSAYVGGYASNTLPLVHPIGGPSAHCASGLRDDRRIGRRCGSAQDRPSGHHASPDLPLRCPAARYHRELHLDRVEPGTGRGLQSPGELPPPQPAPDSGSCRPKLSLPPAACATGAVPAASAAAKRDDGARYASVEGDQQRGG